MSSVECRVIMGGYCTISRDFSHTLGYVARYYSTANCYLPAANYATHVQEEEAEQGCLEHDFRGEEKKKTALSPIATPRSLSRRLQSRCPPQHSPPQRAPCCLPLLRSPPHLTQQKEKKMKTNPHCLPSEKVFSKLDRNEDTDSDEEILMMTKRRSLTTEDQERKMHHKAQQKPKKKKEQASSQYEPGGF